MALQLGALRDALIDESRCRETREETLGSANLSTKRQRIAEAGASPEKAAKAAEELAAYENRFDGFDARLG